MLFQPYSFISCFKFKHFFYPHESDKSNKADQSTIHHRRPAIRLRSVNRIPLENTNKKNLTPNIRAVKSKYKKRKKKNENNKSNNDRLRNAFIIQLNH